MEFFPTSSVLNATITGKDNLPFSSKSNISDSCKKTEEEAVMSYMRSVYLTKGQSLLNNFRSKDPLRTAPAQIDDNDRLRAEELRKLNLLAVNKSSIKESVTPSATELNSGSFSDNNGGVPMVVSEEIVSQISNLSQ